MKTKPTKKQQDLYKRLFKPARKGDAMTAAYLYEDGHATACFERYIRDVDKTIRYYKQIDSLGFDCRFKGRIVFHRYGGPAWLRSMMAAGCTSIYATAPSIDHGSENTKSKGILVGYVTASTKFGDVSQFDFPGLISGVIHYQSDVVEAFDPSADRFAELPVVESIITREAAAVETVRP
jgi:hypothetical protein